MLKNPQYGEAFHNEIVKTFLANGVIDYVVQLSVMNREASFSDTENSLHIITVDFHRITLLQVTMLVRKIGHLLNYSYISKEPYLHTDDFWNRPFEKQILGVSFNLSHDVTDDVIPL